MIREFSVKTKPTNRKAHMLFAGLTSMAMAAILASMLIPIYRGVVSLVGVGLFTAAIVIYTRYVGAVYYYDITYDYEGLPLFVVRQLTGRRESTLCRIGLHEIVKIQDETPKQTREHRTPMGYKKYSYLPTVMPQTAYRITTVSRYEKAEIMIEASGEFINLLRQYAAEARENYIEQE